jgi:hypothetical protein
MAREVKSVWEWELELNCLRDALKLLVSLKNLLLQLQLLFQACSFHPVSRLISNSQRLAKRFKHLEKFHIQG